MKRDAKEHAAEDMKKKEEIDSKNAADGLIFSTEKQLAELGDKIPSDKRPALEGALEKLKDATKNGTTESIKNAMDELSKVWNDVSSNLYQAPGAETNASEPTQNTDGSGHTKKSGNDGEVENAEFEVIDGNGK